jgi:hypothetical protein
MIRAFRLVLRAAWTDGLVRLHPIHDLLLGHRFPPARFTIP